MKNIREIHNSMGDSLIFIEKNLEKMKTGRKQAMQASLAAEAAISQMLEHAPAENKDITIEICKRISGLEIIIEIAGDNFNMTADSSVLQIDEEYKNEDERADFVLGLIKNAFKNQIHMEHRKNYNRAHIRVEESDRSELAFTFLALLLGCLVGFILHLTLGRETCELIDEYLFGFIKELFIRALQIIVAPLVFFSMASCISRFTNLSDLGRLGMKTMGLYFLTTIVAIGIGFALFTAFPSGNPGLRQYIDSQADEEEEDEELQEVKEGLETVNFSIFDTTKDIVPDNLVKAFTNVNLLQIIFLAVLMGTGVGRRGEYSKVLQKGIECFNKLFMSVTEIITSFVPIVIFCSMAELVMLTGFEALLSLMSYAALVVGGMLCMILFYCLFVLVTTGLNPLIFLKKFSRAMFTAFAVSSGAATMPTSMQCCRKMGMDNKVVSFTIPLGANVNMDGSCMVFIITVLFMSRIFGIELSGGVLFSVFVSIIFLSLGSPSVAGADLVILAVLLAQIGIPVEAIGFIMGIDAIFDMVQAVSNTTGDAAVSLVVAKSENLLDSEVYNS